MEQESEEELREYLEREVHLARLIQAPVKLVWVLMGVIIVVWLLAKGWGIRLYDELGDQPIGVNAEQLVFLTGMKISALIDERGQWWRLVSSVFVHMDMMHLMFNAYGLYALGPLCERFYGWRRTLGIFVLSGLLASVASYLWTSAPSGGASGALYGLVGAAMMFGYKHHGALPERVTKALTTGMMPWVVFGIGIGFLSFLPMDNAAHIGGLVSGGLLALVMRSRLEVSQTDGAGWLMVAASALVLAWGAWGWGDQVMSCAGSIEQLDVCYGEVLSRARSSRP
jgi:rhomboid protease GluP